MPAKFKSKKSKIICTSLVVVVSLFVALYLAGRYRGYTVEKSVEFSQDGKDYIYLSVRINSQKDLKRDQNFSISLNGVSIFNYDDLYLLSSFDPESAASLYLYDFQKEDLNNLKYRLVFVVKTSLLKDLNQLQVSMPSRSYSVREVSLTKMDGKIEEKLGHMYKLLELISYYKEQVSMDYKNIYLAYSGYNKLKNLIFENNLDPIQVDQSIKNFSIEKSLIDLTSDIVEELHFDAQRSLILSNEDKAKDRYLELLGFYKNNRMVQSLDIEDVLTGG